MESSLKSENMKIIFACTSLQQSSTLISFFTYIQNKLNTYIPNFSKEIKDAYFVYKVELENIENMKLFEDRYGLDILEKKNYRFIDIYNSTLIEFLEKSEQKFDVIVFTQCSNLIDTIIYHVKDKTENIYEDRPSLTISKNQLFENIKILYDSLYEDGWIFNFYYFPIRDVEKISDIEERKIYESEFKILKTLNKFSSPYLLDFDYYFSPYVFEHIDVFLFLVKSMNKLFIRIDKGVYRKRKVPDIDNLLEKTYDETMIEISKWMKEYDVSKSLEQKYSDVEQRTGLRSYLSESDLELLSVILSKK
jgi:hypothetical protein